MGSFPAEAALIFQLSVRDNCLNCPDMGEDHSYLSPYSNSHGTAQSAFAWCSVFVLPRFVLAQLPDAASHSILVRFKEFIS